MDHREHTNHVVKGENSPKEYIKFALVIAAITTFSYYLSTSVGDSTMMDFARYFMGVFFVVFASFKLVGYKMFVMMFAGYDVLAKRSKIYAHTYPFIELGLGLLYLTNSFGATRDILTILVMGLGTIGVYREIKKRSGIHCACLGNVIKLPLSTVSLIEDVGMGLMAVGMIALR